MLHKTRGIVLKTISHGDTSVICQVFTEKFGLQSYIIHGAKRNKAKINYNILQPLHLLDMVVYHKNNGNIQRVSEARQSPLFLTIPYELEKSAMALYLTEVLFKCLKQQDPDEYLFEYIFSAVSWLDSTEKAPPNFHLYFLLRLSKFLGFYPALPKANQHYFDLKNGVFCSRAPHHSFVLQEPHTSQWASLLAGSFETLATIRIPVGDRRILLKYIIDFYRLHIESFGEIKSHLVLEEVLG
jgi:DNA repair protein RecO (recombination protein O)